MQFLVLVIGDARPRLRPARPGLYQARRQLPAGLDQERARAHGGVAQLERQHLLRLRVGSEPLEGRLQRVAHDRLGQRARRVVAAGAPALVGRLQQRRARWRNHRAG